MSVDCNGIRFLEFAHPSTGRQITRLAYRGWFVDVDAAVGGITVPAQVLSTQHADDLVQCLEAARTYALQHAPVVRRTPPVQAPALRPAAAPTASTLAAVLREARIIAAEQWHPNNRDIYECTQTAWERTPVDVPYAAVLRALRQVLSDYPAANLAEVNDNARTRAEVVAFYDRALAALPSDEPAKGAA